jgi:hypothetical protein
MPLCVILSLSNCATPGVATDSFCHLYEPVIKQKGDSEIAAKRQVKDRILGNEQIHRGLCVTKPPPR